MGTHYNCLSEGVLTCTLSEKKITKFSFFSSENNLCILHGPVNVIFQCTKTCGTGVKSRDILCLDSRLNVSSSCKADDRPAVRRSCNTQSCDLPQLDEGLIDCSLSYFRKIMFLKHKPIPL